jgi:hypothetical protein
MSHRIFIPKSEKIIKQEQRKAKLATLAKKKERGKLTLEDVNEKLDVIIEILQDLMPPK